MGRPPSASKKIPTKATARKATKPSSKKAVTAVRQNASGNVLSKTSSKKMASKKSSNTAGRSAKAAYPSAFAENLAVEQLVGLRGEMQSLRDYPPITQRKDGKYEGDILGFVKGLRLSARVAYFLRERLSTIALDVNWGHVINHDEQSCSQECDVIIHEPGYIRKWNGGDKPIMNFVFVRSTRAKSVVSCKSTLTSIDKDHSKNLKKFGVKHVYILAETCKESRFKTLQAQAKAAGYRGVWCLYFENDLGHVNNEFMLRDFSNMIYTDSLKLESKSSAPTKKTASKVSTKRVSRDAASFPK